MFCHKKRISPIGNVSMRKIIWRSQDRVDRSSYTGLDKGSKMGYKKGDKSIAERSEIQRIDELTEQTGKHSKRIWREIS